MPWQWCVQLLHRILFFIESCAGRPCGAGIFRESRTIVRGLLQVMVKGLCLTLLQGKGNLRRQRAQRVQLPLRSQRLLTMKQVQLPLG